MRTRIYQSNISLIALLICCVLSNTDGARILGFFPTPSKSHLLIHSAIADALAEAGHDVTVLTTLPNVYKSNRYRFVEVENITLDQTFAANVVNKPAPVHKHFDNMLTQMGGIANESLSHPTTQEFLRSNGEGSFDLIIVGYFLNDFFLGLGAYFKCPVVVSFMVRSIPNIDAMVGNPLQLAYVPMLFTGMTQPLDFSGRVKNFVASLLGEYLLKMKLNRRMKHFYNYHFPADRYPSLDEMRKNVSLVLTNHHFSQGPIRPNVPALIEIGGIQIKEKPDPLPKDLETIMTNAKNGIIYFSLGSNVQGSILPKEKAKIMFDVLSKLPYTVLWKWGDSDFPGTSPNIIYKSWLPQDDILAHPNVKLFITHGGQGSVVESQYHGIPMVGIPLFGDQPANMANVERSGFGVSLSYVDLTEADFAKAIDEVLHNSKYSDAVKQFSRLYRDRPMTARQSVVYWVEYVIRHRGARHMQSPAVHMNAFQLMSLDVIGFLAAIVGVVVLILVKLCKFLCCRGKGKKPVTKSKKNK